MERLQQADRISVSLGAKIMLRQFEPVDAHFSLSSDVPEGLDRKLYKDALLAEVRGWLDAEIKNINNQRSIPIKDEPIKPERREDDEWSI